MTKITTLLMAGASMLAVSAGWQAAQAAAYAYATTQITDLRLRFDTGARLPTPGGTSNQKQNDSAVWNGSGPGNNAQNSTIGGTLDVAQATAGPGLFPGPNTFTQAMTGNAYGSRGDAEILNTTIVLADPKASVLSVAEGHAASSTALPDLGSGHAQNTSLIAFTLSPSDLVGHNKITISFNALWSVVATSQTMADSADATISNSIQIKRLSSSYSQTYQPSELNAFVSVSGGNSDSSSGFQAFSFTTGALLAGSYQISLSSIADVNVTGLSNIPEPMSTALLGSGLLGLSLLRRSRAPSRNA